MKHRNLHALFFVLPAAALLISARAENDCVAHYQVVSRGFTVGSAEIVRSHVLRDGRELVRCEATTKIDIGLLILNVHMNRIEKALIGPDGVLEFNIKQDKDGRRLEATGVRSNGIFHCVRIDNGVTNRADIARTNYLATTLDGTELTLDRQDVTVTNRVFECARCETFDRTFRWVDDDEIKVGDRKIKCRVVEYADDQKHGKRWIYRDEFGSALARQDVHDLSGSYSVRLKEIIMRPAATNVDDNVAPAANAPGPR